MRKDHVAVYQCRWWGASAQAPLWPSFIQQCPSPLWGSCPAMLISLIVNIPARNRRDRGLSTCGWAGFNSCFPQCRDKWNAYSHCPPPHVAAAAAAEPRYICSWQMGMSHLLCPCEGTKETSIVLPLSCCHVAGNTLPVQKLAQVESK